MIDLEFGKSLREIWNSLNVGDCVSVEILEPLVIDHHHGTFKNSPETILKKISNWLVNTVRGTQVVAERVSRGNYRKTKDYQDLGRVRKKPTPGKSRPGPTVSPSELGEMVINCILTLRSNNVSLTEKNVSLTHQLRDATEEVKRLRFQVKELKEQICNGSGRRVPLSDLK
ncbi:MAG: hypothetical protein FVQ80_06530 [Planctomycetes bacterium]|nr:hypothetical protein [Planctomycetota bacterium]